jgi:peptide/nickel transport system substrate-binding protein
MKLKAMLAGTALLGLIAASTVQATTLRWAAQNDILTLDPHSQNHATTNAILMHAYEGLTRYSAKYDVEPALATKWTFITPTQVRFELRKGVKFHDGSPFTADDVLFTFNRIRQPQGTMQIYVTGINEIKKIDDFTVDLILAAPNPILLRNIIDFRMMSKTWAEKNRTTNVQDYKAKEENFASRNVNGTGAYQILGWVPDQRITKIGRASCRERVS